MGFLGENARTQLQKEIEQKLRVDYGATSVSDCEFPYPMMKEYLDKRKLIHLSEFVVWDDKKSTRSKLYVNILKMRINILFPNHVKQLVRNEAHVRLASSTWHVCVSQRWFSWLVLCSFLVLSVLEYKFANPGRMTWLNLLKGYYSLALWPAIALLAAEYCRSKINMFFHYQRMREVVSVLENAYTLFGSNNFEKLSAPFEIAKKRLQRKDRGAQREKIKEDWKVVKQNKPQQELGSCVDLSCKGMRIKSEKQITPVDNVPLILQGKNVLNEGPFTLELQWSRKSDNNGFDSGYIIKTGSHCIAANLTTPPAHVCY
jgi:hypothetical protein